MADRIFPNNTQVNMGSKIEFQGINWNEVESLMKNNRFAQDKSQAVLDLLTQAGISLSPTQQIEITDIVDQFADGGEDKNPDNLSQDFERTNTNDHSLDSNFSDDEPNTNNNMTMKISKNNNMRKIAFTHPDQLKAPAIEKALASGDKKLVNTILAARKQNRLNLASKIKQKAQQAMRKAQVGGSTDLGALAAPNAGGEGTEGPIVSPGNDASGGAYQDGFTAGQAAAGAMPEDNKGYTGTDLYKYMEGFFAAQAQKGEGDAGGAGMPPTGLGDTTGVDSTAGDLMPTTAFVSPNKFTQAQRNSFKQIALGLNFPEAYFNAMCGVNKSNKLSKNVESLNNKIKEVHASNISEITKASVIKSLIKEAKLSPDSKSEFIKFWNELLGYQDKSFWPQVAEDYTENKKG